MQPAGLAGTSASALGQYVLERIRLTLEPRASVRDNPLVARFWGVVTTVQDLVDDECA
jgi:hypothetical protein